MDLSQNIEDRNLKCEICENIFSSKYHMNQQIKTSHGEQKLFECNICSRKFGQKHEMICHVENHHQEKQQDSLSIHAHINTT